MKNEFLKDTKLTAVRSGVSGSEWTVSIDLGIDKSEGKKVWFETSVGQIDQERDKGKMAGPSPLNRGVVKGVLAKRFVVEAKKDSGRKRGNKRSKEEGKRERQLKKERLDSRTPMETEWETKV